jgi:hypothetical protein
VAALETQHTREGLKGEEGKDVINEGVCRIVKGVNGRRKKGSSQVRKYRLISTSVS